MNLAILWDAADGDADFARELADLYLVNTAGHLGQLRAALAEGSASRVQRIAHSCKGSSYTCGATALGSLFDELAHLGDEEQLDQAQRVADEVEREFARVQTVLQNSPLPHAAPGPPT